MKWGQSLGVDESNIECDTLEQAHFVIALFVSAVSDVISWVELDILSRWLPLTGFKQEPECFTEMDNTSYTSSPCQHHSRLIPVKNLVWFLSCRIK